MDAKIDAIREFILTDTKGYITPENMVKTMNMVKYLIDGTPEPDQFYFHYLTTRVINQFPTLRHALISNPNFDMRSWGDKKMQMHGKSALILLSIAINLHSDSSSKLITRYLYYIRFEGCYGFRHAFSHTRCHATSYMHTNAILRSWGFVSVEDLNYAGIVMFTSPTYIEDLCEFVVKYKTSRELFGPYSSRKNQFLKGYNGESDRYFISDRISISINPMSVLLSTEITTENKIKWIKYQLIHLKTSGKKGNVYRDEALLYISKLENKSGFGSFFHGTFCKESPLYKIRIDIVMVYIAGYLGFNSRKP